MLSIIITVVIIIIGSVVVVVGDVIIISVTTITLIINLNTSRTCFLNDVPFNVLRSS